jgi:hypothetical protein
MLDTARLSSGVKTWKGVGRPPGSDVAEPGAGVEQPRLVDHGLSRPSRWATAAASPRPATPSLARILETWMLAVFGGDEQRLADLPVGSALGDQREHLSLPPGETKRCRWGGRRLGCRDRRPAVPGPDTVTVKTIAHILVAPSVTIPGRSGRIVGAQGRRRRPARATGVVECDAQVLW